MWPTLRFRKRGHHLVGGWDSPITLVYIKAVNHMLWIPTEYPRIKLSPKSPVSTTEVFWAPPRWAPRLWPEAATPGDWAPAPQGSRWSASGPSGTPHRRLPRCHGDFKARKSWLNYWNIVVIYVFFQASDSNNYGLWHANTYGTGWFIL